VRAFAAQPVLPYTLGYINAGSDSSFEVTTLDADDAPFAATEMQYRVDDLQSGTNIVPWTTISSPEAIQAIDITPAQNALVNTWNDTELRRVTIKVTDDDGKIGQQIFLYSLVNISTPGLS
jgi:hypothetical protein